MSQAEIGNLRVRMGLDTAEFNSGVRSVQGSIAGLSSTLKGFATAAAASMVFNATVSAVKAVAEIGDVAESIGVTAEQLQVFQKMALASGASTDVMTRGLQSLAEQSTQAGSALDKLFTANGIVMAGKDMNQIILEFMTLLQNAKTPAEQLAIATEVLGTKVGRQLVEALRTGASGWNEAFNSMVEDGYYLSNEQVKAAQAIETKYNQVIANLTSAWQGFAVTVAEVLGAVANPDMGSPANKFRFNSGLGAAPGVPPKPAPGGAAGGKGDLPGNINSGDGYSLNKPTANPFNGISAPKAAKAGKDPLDAMRSEGQSVWDSTRNAVERYQIEIRKLNDLMRAGVIDNDTYTRAVQQLQDGFSQATPEANFFGDALTSISDSIATGLTDALAGIISGTMSAKEAFAQMAQSIIQSLADIAAEILRSNIIKMVGSIAGGALGGLGGGMSFGGFYAAGGYLGSGKWGIAGEAGPEIIHGPARITPMDQTGGGVNVTVINNTPAKVNTRQGADGGLTIEVVEDAVATAISRGGNKIDSAMQRGFGLRRAGR